MDTAKSSTDTSAKKAGAGKGHPKWGGRTKGTPNKKFSKAREFMALIVERNIDNFEVWLKQVAADDPGKAAELYLKACEYHIPKLARTEHTGKDGEAIRHDTTWTIVVPNAATRNPGSVSKPVRA